MGIVSVPLRGKYRGELKVKRRSRDGLQRFPSPCGVNIVANLSPIGLGNTILVVSVPLRGKYRGEYSLSKTLKGRANSVSVPLRGKYRGESPFT